MPEGDTIFKVATRLAPVLEGKELVRFEAPRLVGQHRPRPGMVIDEVEARGKHLLVHFDRNLTLQVHLGMTGSWQLVASGQRWRKPAHLARVVLGVEGWEAVCFSAPKVGTYVTDSPGPTPVSHLGPDLCRPDADVDLALTRMAAIPEPDTSIAEVLLDQRVAAGIGNVYKSEVLFTCGIDPFRSVADIDVVTRLAILETASGQLRSNLGRGRRATVPTGLAVYGRARLPCIRCSTPITMRRHGEQNRSTYWCSRCQT